MGKYHESLKSVPTGSCRAVSSALDVNSQWHLDLSVSLSVMTLDTQPTAYIEQYSVHAACKGSWRASAILSHTHTPFTNDG